MRTVSPGGLVAFLSGFLAVAPAGRAQAGSALDPVETRLLHRRIDLSGVRGFDEKTGHWSPYKKGPEQLLVVHLWDIACAPCISEMPMLRKVVHGWRAHPQVGFLFVSETLDERKLLDYWRAATERVPRVTLYQNTDDRIREVLDTGKQPVTLLVDQDLVVRQAFIGSLEERTNELAASMTRLLSVVQRKK